MYAQRTNVEVEQSQAEINQALRQAGAEEIFTGWSAGAAFLGFSLGGFAVKLVVPMPPVSAFETTPTGRRRSPAQQQAAQEQVQRQRWRALGLMVRAKLEAIELGATTMEREFLADLVLPSGATVSQQIGEQLLQAVSGAPMPRLLPEAS